MTEAFINKKKIGIKKSFDLIFLFDEDQRKYGIMMDICILSLNYQILLNNFPVRQGYKILWKSHTLWTLQRSILSVTLFSIKINNFDKFKILGLTVFWMLMIFFILHIKTYSHVKATITVEKSMITKMTLIFRI